MPVSKSLRNGLLYPLDVASGAGVDLEFVSPFDKEGDRYGGPGLNRSRFRRSLRGIAPHSWIGVRHREFDKVGQFNSEGFALGDEYKGGLVFHKEIGRTTNHLTEDGCLLEGLGVHEVVGIPLRIQVLHLPLLDAHGLDLVAGAEGTVKNSPSSDILQLCADESSALARFYVLKFHDGVEGAIQVHCEAVSEFGCISHVSVRVVWVSAPELRA